MEPELVLNHSFGICWRMIWFPLWKQNLTVHCESSFEKMWNTISIAAHFKCCILRCCSDSCCACVNIHRPVHKMFGSWLREFYCYSNSSLILFQVSRQAMNTHMCTHTHADEHVHHTQCVMCMFQFVCSCPGFGCCPGSEEFSCPWWSTRVSCVCAYTYVCVYVGPYWVRW